MQQFAAMSFLALLGFSNFRYYLWLVSQKVDYTV